MPIIRLPNLAHYFFIVHAEKAYKCKDKIWSNDNTYSSHSAFVCKCSTKMIQVFRQEHPLGKPDSEQRPHWLLLHGGMILILNLKGSSFHLLWGTHMQGSCYSEVTDTLSDTCPIHAASFFYSCQFISMTLFFLILHKLSSLKSLAVIADCSYPAKTIFHHLNWDEEDNTYRHTSRRGLDTELFQTFQVICTTFR